MPHLRERYLKSLLQKSGKFSVVTGIFGHRQVGKTTLASLLGEKYLTLDDPVQLDSAFSDPKAFLANHQATPLVIDECQLAPPLFPVIKEWVRVHPKPGQILLTGSVRFSSRKSIRESLTGRIIAWELLPMNLSEAHSMPLSDAIVRLTQAKSVEIPLSNAAYYSSKEYQKFLVQGGLPGIFAIHDAAIRVQRFDTQINTLLERDLKLVVETTLSYRSLKNLLTVLAFQQNQPLELASVSRQTRISVPTLRRLIAAFEAMFLIRLLPTEGSEKKPVLFFEDQGEASLLTGNRSDELTDLTRFLFAQLRHQFVYRPELEGSLFQYRTRGGAYVPLCFRIKKSVLGIIPILEENPSENAMASARSFFKAYADSKVIFVHLGKNDQIIDRRMRVVGVAQII